MPSRSPNAAAQSKTDHSASASAAGILFQVERALLHLASATSDTAVVGVETLDDVVVMEGDRLAIREQDKHSVGAGRLTERDPNLWKTLAIWLDDGRIADRCLLATNRTVSSEFLKELMRSPSERQRPVPLLKRLEAIAKRGSSEAGIQQTIDRVMSATRSQLRQLIGSVQIVSVNTDAGTVREDVCVRLGVPTSVDRHALFRNLMGWIVTRLLSDWREARPARIARTEVVNQCRAIEAAIAKQRILPQPAAQVLVSASARAAARTKRFTHHLSLVAAGDDDVAQAIDHFIRFNIEKHRLTRVGEVPEGEWTSRSDRLRERWSNILRKQSRDVAKKRAARVGLGILEETTYFHREPLDGSPCDELYMTAGHYHRLADDDAVWWHPHFRVPSKRR